MHTRYILRTIVSPALGLILLAGCAPSAPASPPVSQPPPAPATSAPQSSAPQSAAPTLTIAAPAPTAAATPASLTTVHVAHIPILAMVPMYLADDLGFYAKRGIKNEYTEGNPFDLMSVQSKGDIDVNIPGTSAAFFNAINSGLKVKAVADRMQYHCSSDNMLVIGSRGWDQGIQSIAALKGKRISINARGSGTNRLLDELLHRNNMTEADLGQVLVLGYPDTVNALKTGALDAGWLSEPLAAQVILDGSAKRLTTAHEIFPGQELGLFVYSEQFTNRDNGTPAKQWLSAWLEGVRYYMNPANKAQILKTAQKWTKVDESVLSAMYGTDQWPLMDPNGDLDANTMATQDGVWYLDNKFIDRIPEPNEFYDNRAIKAAQGEVGVVPVDWSCGGITRLS
jgi:NitT/TauT family transport system substrate-binding protein